MASRFGLLIPKGGFAEEYPEISLFLSVKTNKGCLRERIKDSSCDCDFWWLLHYAERLFWLERQVLFSPLEVSGVWLNPIHTSFVLSYKWKQSKETLSGNMRWVGNWVCFEGNLYWNLLSRYRKLTVIASMSLRLYFCTEWIIQHLLWTDELKSSSLN